jgi:hypothetical protein
MILRMWSYTSITTMNESRHDKCDYMRDVTTCEISVYQLSPNHQKLY